MDIFIEDLQSKMIVDEALLTLLKKVVVTCLSIEGFMIPSEVSIFLVDDERIKEINQEQRGIDRATDVLSFPITDMVEGQLTSGKGDYDLDKNQLLLGDIVISLEMARKQSLEYGHAFEREVAFLTTHGMFHLLGYDHETQEEEAAMFEKQESVLCSLGQTRE